MGISSLLPSQPESHSSPEQSIEPMIRARVNELHEAVRMLGIVDSQANVTPVPPVERNHAGYGSPIVTRAFESNDVNQATPAANYPEYRPPVAPPAPRDEAAPAVPPPPITQAEVDKTDIDQLIQELYAAQDNDPDANIGAFNS